jgi:diguanylate cyclase (GGDEF)-like protein/PAS domain S-box-containing protein
MKEANNRDTEKQVDKNLIEDTRQNNKIINLLYNNIFDKIPEPTLLLDNYNIIRCNDALVNLFNYSSREELKSKKLYELFPKQQSDGLDSKNKSIKHIYETMDKGVSTFEWVHKKKDGVVFYSRVILLNLPIAGRNIIHAIINDISKEKIIENSLRESEERFRSLFEENKSNFLIVNPDTGRILDANPSACKFYGYGKEELLNMNIYDINQLSQEEIKREMELARYEKRSFFNFNHRLSNGEIRKVEVYSAPIKIDDTEVLFSIIHDVTEEKKNIQKIKQLTFRDSLTGLYNKDFFLERLDYELNKKWPAEDLVSIVFIDIVNFTAINTEYGYKVGDAILKNIAKELNKVFLECDTIARYGGDKFIILLPYVEAQQDLESIIEILINRIEYFSGRVENKVINVQVNVGITIDKKNNLSSEKIIKHAHIAMAEAKKDNGRSYHFFSSNIKEKQHNAYILEEALLKALENKELFLMYQPIFEMDNGQLVGAEALARWKHPELGIIGPKDFIHIAEKNGSIIEIGDWVLRTVCSFIKKLKYTKNTLIPISVNVSAIQLEQDNFVGKVQSILEEAKINPSYIELEITESTAMQDIETIGKKLEQLKALGVKIAIDDFGTGYSSLSQLHKLKVDKLKIDRSFINNINIDKTSKNIASAILNIANTFNLTTVAEGIETYEQLYELKELKTDMFQGFLFSKPLREEYLINFIDENINIIK